MKVLGAKSFIAQAGVPDPNFRDMSAYDGYPFECVCGSVHEFDSLLNQGNYMTSGANAKMIVGCPDHPSSHTLIQTKYKFLLKFDRFQSLAGCKE